MDDPDLPPGPPDPEAPSADAAAAARIEALIAERHAAREARDFARADAIRARLDAAGVVVMDHETGADWRPGEGFDPARLDAPGGPA